MDLGRLGFVPRRPDDDDCVRILVAGRFVEKKARCPDHDFPCLRQTILCLLQTGNPTGSRLIDERLNVHAEPN